MAAFGRRVTRHVIYDPERPGFVLIFEEYGKSGRIIDMKAMTLNT
jgi:hypothetical protein